MLKSVLVHRRKNERYDKSSRRSSEKNLTLRRGVGTFVGKIVRLTTKRCMVHQKNCKAYDEASYGSSGKICWSQWNKSSGTGI
jgi:hypothetical protein